MKLLFLLSLFFVPLLASGETLKAIQETAEKSWSWQLGGKVYTDQYLFVQSPSAGKWVQSSLSTVLDFEAHDEKGFGIHAVGRMDAFYKSILDGNQASVDFSLREGYLSYLSPGAEIRIGQQIIPWGKSDGVNPTDYFTAKDYTLLNPDEEVKRNGALAANMSLTPLNGNSPFTLQIVAQANSPQTKLLIPDQSIPAGVSFQKYSNPSDYFSNSMEIGAKISFLKSSYDFSISGFSGYSKTAEYIVNPSTFSVSPIHPAETAIGGDGSFTLDSYIIRLETALHMPSNGKDTDPLAGLVQPWHWDSVIGVERPIGSDFRAQVQFLYRWYLYYQNPVINTGNPALDQLILGVAQANALMLNYQRQGNPGATFRFGYLSDASNWTADLFWVGYFAYGQDYLFRPQVGYSPLTNLKLALGADLYGGDSNRPLGALKSRSDAFFEAKYIF